MSQESNVQEIFGKFAVELEGGAKLFDTEAEAVAAEIEFLKGAEVRDEAKGFTDFKGLTGKSAKGKANVLTEYLLWVAAGRPEAPTVEEVEAKEEEEVADVAVTVESDDEEESDTDF